MRDSLTSTGTLYRERKNRALKIFTKNDLNVRLLGNQDSPMFILDDKYMLSCFINGNKLFFRAGPDSSEILRSVNLDGDFDLNKHELTELLEASEHLPVYRIQDVESKLFLVGFNRFRNSIEEFPVFARHKPLIYLNPEKVNSLANKLLDDQYKVEII